jgi:hypothetical protein
MSHFPTRWNALIVVLALVTLTGCQGISSSNPASQSQPQNPVPGPLTAAPSSVPFGNVLVGTSQSQSETLTNTGGTSVTITDAAFTGSGFSATGLSLPVTLAPNQSSTFDVVFAPTGVGPVSGSIAIISNASNPDLSISLSGAGTEAQSQGQLSVSPSTISVGSVTVGTSGTQTATLNATGASVTVSSVSVGSTEFAVNGLSFPVTIAAGQGVSFTVKFTPQTSGFASVAVSFSSNASNSPTPATVTGTGLAAPLHTVNLSWNASTSPNVVGYNIYRSTGTTGNYVQINTVLNAATAYSDTSVVDGQTYYYETTAVNSADEESAPSAAVKAVIPAP